MGKPSKSSAAPKGAAKKPVAKKSPVRPAKPAKPAAAPEVGALGAKAPSLEQLAKALGARDEALEQRVLEAVTEAALVEQGSTFASESIYEAVPAIVELFRAQWAAMTPTRRRSLRGFSPALLAGIVGRCLALRAMERRGASEGADKGIARADRTAHYRAVARKAIAERDQLYVAVREVLPAASPERARWEQSVGTAKDPKALQLGLSKLALELRALLAQGELGPTLRALHVDDAAAEALEAHAAAVRAAGAALAQVDGAPKVLQRALDLEDGKVLRLLTVVYRSWREAAKSDALLRLPPMGPLARLVLRNEKKSDAPVDE